MKDFEIVYSHSKGFLKKDLEPPPELQAGQVLVRPKRLTICGSDVHHKERYQGDELRLGHEWVGQVESVASDVTSFTPGDFITTTATLGCGKCDYCFEGKNNFCKNPDHLGSEKLGALRTYLTIDQNNLVKLNDGNDPASTLYEVAAVGYEAVRLLKLKTHPNPKPLERLIIFGCGSVGLMTALAAKKNNYDILLVDVLKERVERAQKMGFQATIEKALLIDPASQNSFSSIIDCSGDNGEGSGAFSKLPLYGRRGFSAIIVGKYKKENNISPDLLGRLGADLTFMCGMSKKSLEETVVLFKDDIKKIANDFITHTFSIDQVNLAFQMAENKNESLKILIEIG